VPKSTDLKAFEAAIQTLLAPLADYARANGIGARRFAQILADAARGKVPPAVPELPYEAALRLVGRWSMEGAYSHRGKPRLLPFRGKRSFTSLVRSARAGSAERARAALLGAGVVEERRDGSLRLLQVAYVPHKGKKEKVDILGRATAEFLRVLTHNLSAPPENAFLQRVASYDNIGSSSLMTLRNALRREGVRALERANTLLAARDRDRHPEASSGPRRRVSFGVYLLEEPFGAASRRKK
jgi:hypothetical protein